MYRLEIFNEDNTINSTLTVYYVIFITVLKVADYRESIRPGEIGFKRDHKIIFKSFNKFQP